MNNQLVISDGSNKLTLVDPKNYGKTGDIEVYDEKGGITNLNELNLLMENYTLMYGLLIE